MLLALLYITFKKTKRIKNNTKRIATNVRTAIACFSLLGKCKMSDLAIIRH